MHTRTDFWLHVHELSKCLDAEGDTPEERRKNIQASLNALSVVAQQEIVGELRSVLAELNAVNRSLVEADIARMSPDWQGTRQSERQSAK